jgi:hypothetical protein
MHRTTAHGSDGATARNPAAKVAPLLRLYGAADAATSKARYARAAELLARAAAAAEAALDGGEGVASLIVATLLREQITAHAMNAGGHSESVDVVGARVSAAAAQTAALLARALDISRARWRAGTLFAPTPEEAAFFQECAGLPARKAGIVALLNCAVLSLCTATQQQNLQDDDALLCAAVLDALRAALEADARGLLELPQPQRDGAAAVAAAATATSDMMERAADKATQCTLQELLQAALDHPVQGAAGLLAALRTRHGLMPAEEAALRALLRRVDASLGGSTADADMISLRLTSMRQRAADDVARHGLRACGLPGCAAAEPHPKAFKVCGRCRGVVYCSAAHQQQDWRRHKREDGCKAAA